MCHKFVSQSIYSFDKLRLLARIWHILDKVLIDGVIVPVDTRVNSAVIWASFFQELDVSNPHRINNAIELSALKSRLLYFRWW